MGGGKRECQNTHTHIYFALKICFGEFSGGKLCHSRDAFNRYYSFMRTEYESFRFRGTGKKIIGEYDVFIFWFGLAPHQNTVHSLCVCVFEK